MRDLNQIIKQGIDLETVVTALRKTLGYSIEGIAIMELLPWVLTLLNDNNITFAVSGGFARSVYAPFRLTQDIDISIASQKLKVIDSILQQNGFMKKDELEYNTPSKRVIHKYTYEDKELDLLIFDKEFTDEILNTSQNGKLANQVVRIVSPEMLVLQKMLSFRNKDKADIIEIRDAITLDMGVIKIWASKLKMFDRMSILQEEKD